MDDAAMDARQAGKGLRGTLPPWVVIAALGVLLPLFAAMTLMEIRRHKESGIRLLEEKGAALIRSFEAGTRSGMMDRPWGDPQLQRLLGETARQPDIVYILVTDLRGRVVAHSDPSQIGTQFGGGLDLEALVRDGQLQWRQVQDREGREVFEIFRRFTPTGPPAGMMRGRMMRHGMGLPPPPSPAPAEGAPAAGQVIFMGLDLSTVEAVRAGETRQSLILGAVMLLAAFAGILIVLLTQGYRATRASLTRVQAFSDDLVARLPLGLVALDEAGRLAAFNRAAEKVLALKAPSVVGRPGAAVLPPELLRPLEAARQGKDVRGVELTCPRGDGEEIPLDVGASVLRDEEGRSLGQVLLLRDLSEVRALRREVARSQRLAAVGMLAAGVAHEIRNPLSSIKGFATYFRDRYREEPEDGRIAQILIGEVERLNRVVGQLLEVSRPVTLTRRRLPLAHAVRKALELVERQLGEKGIRVETHLGGGEISAPVDPDRLNQVLLNLLLNAIEALQPGGLLRVTLEAEDGAGEVRIGVQDSGCGIAPEALPRIFDPYFTTRPQGTGLGLAIVHNIVEAHGGRIAVESRVGQGSRFTVCLPSGEGADAAQRPAEAPLPTGRGEGCGIGRAPQKGAGAPPRGGQ
jgi:two-component system sensor histidine kinase HydH